MTNQGPTFMTVIPLLLDTVLDQFALYADFAFINLI